jgi:opacity protein-like surface antigen
MKSNILFSVSLIALAPIAVANAAVPKLSGAYIYQSEEICPAVLAATQATSGPQKGAIINLIASSMGEVTTNDFRVTFTPGAGTPYAGKIAGSGYQVDLGPLVKVTGTGQTSGSASEKAVSVSGTYSNTANSITITSENKQALNVVYGTVKTGIVQTAAFSFLAGGCVEHGSLTHE